MVVVEIHKSCSVTEYAIYAGVRGTQTVSLQTPQRTDDYEDVFGHIQLVARNKFH